jgi:Skp family chaperone for outer membrane proteins
MRSKQFVAITVAMVVLATVAISFSSYSYAAKDAAVAKPVKIALVNLREIFQKNKLNEVFDQQMEQEKGAAMQEIDTTQKTIDLLKSEMKAMTVGTKDYLSRMEKALSLQGTLQAKKEYYQQYMDSKQQRFTEDVYTKTKDIIADYAARNGIDIVMVKDEIQFPSASPNDLMLALSTRKVLYSAPEMDITAPILEALNAKAVTAGATAPVAPLAPAATK